MKWAQAMLINTVTGLIEKVGTEDTIDAPTDAQVFNMEGRLILPGFQDAHLHAVEAGINEDLCLFDEDSPIDELKYYFAWIWKATQRLQWAMPC